MIYLRVFLVWLIIIATETCHGISRNLYLAPRIGDFRSRQIGVLIATLLIFIISLLFIKFIKASGKKQLLFIGMAWVILTLIFEVSLGRLLHLSWERILSDYNLLKGGLMPIGLILTAFSPLAAAKVRGLLP
ncbi:MAG: hypothetical protein KAX69_05720 [Chitinophagales bacterium]|nr:hypothetical protein [Chitinophagales bacterium]